MTNAYLFDIDGCLTLNGKSKSILDRSLIDKIFQLSAPVAFVTGRSDGWLKKQYQEIDRLEYLQIPTYIEFGLAWIDNHTIKLQKSAKDFLTQRDRFINRLKEITDEKNIYFEPYTWYDDYPQHGSLWVERKHIQLSIAENTEFSTEELHDLVKIAWKGMEDDARILFHHLGVDVIPKNWSKAEATRHFVQDMNQERYHWFVFGDNKSDQEMLLGLDQAEFISTKHGASDKVRSKLLQLNSI